MAHEDGTRRDVATPNIPLPRWVFGLVVGATSLVTGAALSWAVNIDMTQRSLLQDVAVLKANTATFSKQLERIEGKVDKLQQINSKLDKLLKQGQQDQP